MTKEKRKPLNYNKTRLYNHWSFLKIIIEKVKNTKSNLIKYYLLNNG